MSDAGFDILVEALQGIAVNAHFTVLDNFTMHPAHQERVLDFKVAAMAALKAVGVEPEARKEDPRKNHAQQRQEWESFLAELSEPEE